jgi:hypothetical protein
LNQVHRCPKRGSDGEETVVKIRMFVVLALTMLAVSACVVEPGGYYGGGHGYYGGGHGYYNGGHERGVWRG